MKTIELTEGLITFVDDEDYDRILSFGVWKARKHVNGQYYAMCGNTSMQRVVLNAVKGEVVDHKDGDTLDNRRSNLRVCTRQENAWNSKARRGKSRYKGVWWNYKKWSACYKKNRKTIYLGSFPTEEDAARAYDEAARREFGEFACTNFPKEGERCAV